MHGELTQLSYGCYAVVTERTSQKNKPHITHITSILADVGSTDWSVIEHEKSMLLGISAMP